MHGSRGPVTILTVVVLCTFISGALAQALWEKQPVDPVLPVGPAGSWDESMAVATSVMFDEGIYKMWYEGDGGFGYATSIDGLVWSKHGNNPVLQPGPPGAWDEVDIDQATVVFAEGSYRMWYSGVDATNTNRIGLALSPDGIDWTKYGDHPVLDLGDPGSMDDHEVIHPCVIYENGLYRMWYNGHDGTTQRILYAYSFDGVEWNRFTDHAMLEPGPPGSWDDSELGPMCVLPGQNAYRMWYTGWNQDQEFRIGYAWSPDGLLWRKNPLHNPVLGPGEPGLWDDEIVALPSVILDGADFRMWYGGGGTIFRTGHATSPDVTSVGGGQDALAIDHVRRFALLQNQPNPFNPRTVIPYHLLESAPVSLQVFDVAGRLVRRLLDDDAVGAGTHAVPWDGRDDTGRPVSAGVYFYRLAVAGSVETRRMTMIK
jgi:predicted GH43/DUF377 family glycosyl hydrolase